MKKITTLIFAVILFTACKKEDSTLSKSLSNIVVINNVSYPIREFEINYHSENDNMTMEIYPDSQKEIEIEIEMFEWSKKSNFNFSTGGSYENGNNMFALSYDTIYNENYKKACAGSIEIYEYIEGVSISGKGNVNLSADTIYFEFKQTL